MHEEMIRILSTLALIVAFFISSSFGQAPIYYVNPSGNTSFPCGTSANPCQNLQLLTNIPSAVVIMSSGVYNTTGSCSLVLSHQSWDIRGVAGHTILQCVGGFSGWSTVYSNLTLTGLTFASSDSDSSVGSLFLISSLVRIYSCSFIGNSGIQYAGSIFYSDFSSGEIVDSYFAANSVSEGYACSACAVGGGAISVDNTSILSAITNCTFIGNGVSSTMGQVSGAALSFANPAVPVTITNSYFAQNYAVASYVIVGGVINTPGLLTLVNCTFLSNTATQTQSNGDGITGTAVGAGTLVVVNCTFTNMSSTVYALQGIGQGGVLSANTATVSDSLFYNNTMVSVESQASAANLYGGAVNLMGAGSFVRCTFVSNVVNIGGSGSAQGGAVTCGDSCIFSHCQLSNNAAIASSLSSAGSASGGAVLSYANVSLDHSSFSQNRVSVLNSGQGLGGAVFSLLSAVVSDCVFAYNEGTAPNSQVPGSVFGGSINSQGGVFAVNTSFIGNSLTLQESGEAEGGAVTVAAYSEFTDCVFSANFVSCPVNVAGNVQGGALFSLFDVRISRCTFANNSASIFNTGAAQGGAVLIVGHAVIADSQFLSNIVLAPASSVSGSVYGGAVHSVGSGPLTLLHSSFYGNAVSALGSGSAEGGAVFVGGGLVWIQDCEFFANSVSSGGISTVSTSVGGAVSIQGSGTVADSVFALNYAALNDGGSASGGAVACTNLPVSFARCQFVENVLLSQVTLQNAQLQGGAVFGSQVSLDSCVFGRNAVNVASAGDAHGGAVYLDSGNVTNSFFVANFARTLSQTAVCTAYGGALSAGDSVTVSDSQFEDNYATVSNSGTSQGGALWVNVNLTVTRSQFLRNSANSPQVTSGSATVCGGAVYAEQVVADLCMFSNNSISVYGCGTAAGGALSCVFGNVMSSQFYSNTAYSYGSGSANGGAVGDLYYVSTAKVIGNSVGLLIIASSQFTNNYAKSGEGVGRGGAVSFRCIVASDVTASMNSVLGLSQSYGGALYGYDVTLANVTMRYNSALCNIAQVGTGGAVAIDTDTISHHTSSQGTLSSLRITGNVADYGGGVAFMGSGPLTVQNSSFHVNVANVDGGALLTNAPCSVSLAQCLFSLNRAQSGGGLFVGDNTYLSFSGFAQFNDNSATIEGGGLFLDSLAFVQFSPYLVLIGNSASVGGGGIFYNGNTLSNLPNIDSLHTSQNLGNMGAYGPLIASPLNTTHTLVIPQSFCGNVPAVPLVGKIAVPSGCQVSVTVFLLDIFGQPYVTTSSNEQTSAQVQLERLTAQEACIGGNAEIVVTNGVANFTVAVTGNPGAVFVGRTLVRQNSLNLYSDPLEIHIDACSPGFGQVDTACASCQKCITGTYNLNGDGVCQQCFTTTTASDGEIPLICAENYVFTIPNYWAIFDSNGTVSAFACTDGECKGGCQPGHPISSCEEGVVNTTTCYPTDVAKTADGIVSGYCEVINRCSDNRAGFMCGGCANSTYAMWGNQCVECTNPSTGLLVVVFFGMWLQVLVLYIGLSNRASAATKSLVYFVQVSLFMLGPNDTVSLALSVLNIHPSAGSLCLYHRDYFGSFLAQLVTPLIMLAQLLISCVVIYGVNRARGNEFDTSRWLIRPLTALLLSVYTPVSTAVLNMLRCRTAGDFYVLTAAPMYYCSGSRYTPYFITSLALAIGFVFGVPIILLILLVVYRRRLEEPDVKRRYGYIYEACKSSCFWWEVVVLARRSVLSVISLVQSTNRRTLGLSIGCVCILLIQLAVHPFSSFMENLTELFALAVLVLVANISSSALHKEFSSELDLTFAEDAIVGVTVVCLLVVALYSARASVALVGRGAANLILRILGRPQLVDPDNSDEVDSSVLLKERLLEVSETENGYSL